MVSREKELFKQLLEKTQTGKIQWEPTAKADEFVTTLAGKYTFTVGSYQHDYELQTLVVMRDDADRYMMTISPAVGEVTRLDLDQLHAEARKAALKVDESIDQVLADLKQIQG